MHPYNAMCMSLRHKGLCCRIPLCAILGDRMLDWAWGVVASEHRELFEMVEILDSHDCPTAVSLKKSLNVYTK